MLVAGVDGCKGGWICLAKNLSTGEVTTRMYAHARELVEQVPRPAVLMIDIPIGLPEANSRSCDVQARQLLGIRKHSVFAAPIRPAIQASSREEASEATAEADGRRVGSQAWGIFPKTRQLDDLLGTCESLRQWVFEVHPELSFWAGNGACPGAEMQFHKKKASGRTERRNWICRYFNAVNLSEALSAYPRSVVGQDDICDAFAALWTAERKHSGLAIRVPCQQETDIKGIAMEIWY